MGLEQWLDAQKKRLLRCDHYHVVFTAPHELEPLWHTHRKRMTSLFYECAKQSLLSLLGDPKHLGAHVGVVVTLHTWGRTLNFHPHVHCLVSGGGWDGTRWKPIRSGYLLPVRVVQSSFRGRLLSAVKKDLDEGRLVAPNASSPVAFDNTLRRLWQKKWNVRVERGYRSGDGVLVYLARYLRGGPISNRRIIAENDERVVMRYTDHRDGRTKTLTLARDHFLQRVLWHVPNPGTHSVRYWGIYARCLAPVRAPCRIALGQVPEPPREQVSPRLFCERKGWIEPMLCKICEAPLVIVEELPRGREPPKTWRPHAP